jgi:hypothetical protein
MSERSRYRRASIIAGPSVVSPWRARPRRHPYVVHLETGGPRAEMRGVVDVNEFRTPDREAPVCRGRALEDIYIEP